MIHSPAQFPLEGFGGFVLEAASEDGMVKAKISKSIPIWGFLAMKIWI
jgi:hypothetical protein